MGCIVLFFSFGSRIPVFMHVHHDSPRAQSARQYGTSSRRRTGTSGGGKGVESLGTYLGSALEASPQRADLATRRPASLAEASSRVAVIYAWSLTLVNPLIDRAWRERVRASMAALVDSEPTWAAAYFAGLLGAVAHSLPDDDPWRRLTACLDVGALAGQAEDVNCLVRVASDEDRGMSDADVDHMRMRSHPDGMTGAMHPCGAPFGLFEDCTDIEHVDGLSPELHPRASTCAVPLAPLAAALLAVAGQSQDVAQHAYSRVAHALSIAACRDDEASDCGTALLDAAEAALCWLTYRRSAFEGTRDSLMEMAAMRWIPLTDEFLAGSEPRALADEWPHACIDKGAWHKRASRAARRGALSCDAAERA